VSLLNRLLAGCHLLGQGRVGRLDRGGLADCLPTHSGYTAELRDGSTAEIVLPSYNWLYDGRFCLGWILPSPQSGLLPLLGLLLECRRQFVPPQDGHCLLSGVQVADSCTTSCTSERFAAKTPLLQGDYFRPEI
jgi:hypothetical protein